MGVPNFCDPSATIPDNSGLAWVALLGWKARVALDSAWVALDGRAWVADGRAWVAFDWRAWVADGRAWVALHWGARIALHWRAKVVNNSLWGSARLTRIVVLNHHWF